MACSGPPYCMGNGGNVACGCVTKCRCCPPPCITSVSIPVKCSGSQINSVPLPDPPPPVTPFIKKTIFPFKVKALDAPLPCYNGKFSVCGCKEGSEPTCPPYTTVVPTTPINLNWYDGSYQSCQAVGRDTTGSGFRLIKQFIVNKLQKKVKSFFRPDDNSFSFNASNDNQAIQKLSVYTTAELESFAIASENAALSSVNFLIDAQDAANQTSTYANLASSYATIASTTGDPAAQTAYSLSTATTVYQAVNSATDCSNAITSVADLTRDAADYADLIAIQTGDPVIALTVTNAYSAATTADNAVLAITAQSANATLAADNVTLNPTPANAVLAANEAATLLTTVNSGLNDATNSSDAAGSAGIASTEYFAINNPQCYAGIQNKNIQISFSGCCLISCYQGGYEGGFSKSGIGFLFYAQGSGTVTVSMPDTSPCDGEYQCSINGQLTTSLAVNSCDAIFIEIEAVYGYCCCTCCIDYDNISIEPYVQNFVNTDAYHTSSRGLNKSTIRKNIRQIKL